MKRIQVTLIAISLGLLFLTVSVFSENLTTSWPFVAEVNSNAAASGLYDFVVPLPVLDKAREDLGDARLYDVQNREIPYALLIRREVDEQREIGGTTFNESTVGSSTELSVDLGENPAEHNAVEIQTAGTNFRRGVRIEGSDSGKDWRTLNADGVIFAFESQNKSVESNRVDYPTSRYRYLRLRVFGDELTDRVAPHIVEVKVTMALHAKGELTTWGVAVPNYQLLRNQGAHASSWTIDLGGRLPCDRLVLDIAEPSFSRPFQIEAVDDPQNPRLIATGDLVRRVAEEPKPVVITFDREEQVRKLRLLVTDYSNQTLSIQSIQASAPARQIIFELKDPKALPVRLFFGNPNITAPHYDFEKDLPAKLSSQLNHGIVGNVTANSAYEPEPLPLTERIPWLIYVVLAASSLALALILINLSRATLRTSP